MSKRDPNDHPPLDPAVWRHILAQVRAQHPQLNRQWFEELRPRQLSNNVIQVLTRDAAQMHFCQSQCAAPFTSAAQAITGRLVAVHFHCENLPSGGVFTETDTLLPLNPDYRFEHFVQGPCNRLAHAASMAVADKPAQTYNPLFIHGGVGLGKTHLLQAVCQSYLERSPDSRILFLSCDSFINQFIAAVEKGEMSSFRNRYRHVDMLVIDDIHFLAGHDRTQEEFFHTFNTLHGQQKQIILSADCAPSEIGELEERLISRFNWGLVARVEKPGYETRVAILKRKARIRGLELQDEVFNYVAAKIDNNTRELEGAITRLQGMAMLVTGGKIDMELTRSALGDMMPPDQARISLQQIFDVVTRYFSVKLQDLQGKKRNKSIAWPRQVAMYLVRKHMHYSLEEIGGYFGGRDHTTVLHGVRTVERLCDIDKDIARQVNQLESQVAP